MKILHHVDCILPKMAFLVDIWGDCDMTLVINLQHWIYDIVKSLIYYCGGSNE